MLKKLACGALMLCSWSAQALDIELVQDVNGNYYRNFSLGGPGTFSAALSSTPSFVFTGVYLDDVSVGAWGGQSWIIDPFNLSAGNHTVRVQGTGTGTVSASLNYVAAVPEPESAGMLLAGLGVLGALQRRRSKARAARLQSA